VRTWNFLRIAIRPKPGLLLVPFKGVVLPGTPGKTATKIYLHHEVFLAFLW
jgi:hypothetical protein